MLKRIKDKLFRSGRKSEIDTSQTEDVVEPKQPELEVILVDDSELAVFGEKSVVDKYLRDLAIPEPAGSFSLEQLINPQTVSYAANAVEAVAQTLAQQGQWLKLTKESAAQIRANGLIPTSSPGINYVATGKPGSVDKWIRTESGSFLSNPAVLASVASMVAQMAISSELAQMREMLQVIDQKLDSIARTQRDQYLAKLDRVKFALEDARHRAEAQGGKVNELTWSQIQAENGEIDEVQAMALRAIANIIDDSRGAGVKKLGKTAGQLGRDAAVWISVLGRSLELRDELAVFELGRTSSMEATEALNHRVSVRKALDERRKIIGVAVENFSHGLQAIAPLAFEAVVLHAQSSKKLVEGLNVALEVTGSFGKALGKELEIAPLEATPWIRAALDEGQRKEAVKQIVVPVVETAKEVAKTAKDKALEILDEINRNDKNK